MKYDYHIAVIGAGSGGLVVASAGASLGAKVALLEGEKMGGDCLNYGCVPSKSFLKSAHLAAEIKAASKLGVNASLGDCDLAKVMGRVSSVISEIEPHDSVERYEGLGVDVLQVSGSLVDRHTVQAGNRTITAKHIVIATGSSAAIPPIPGLSDVNYLTNKTIFSLETMPKHLIVLGAGPIGLELGQGFAHLGSKVSVIDMNERLFTKDEPEVGPIMQKRLEEDGLNLFLKSRIMKVSQSGQEIAVDIQIGDEHQRVVGDALLVALGRAPQSQGLNLEKLGVKLSERGFIKTNEHLQTTVPNIYACGDVTGPYQFTHMAGYQAGIVVRNALFPFFSKVNYSAVPWTTYTKPEVAHVGELEESARSKGLLTDTVLVDLNRIDRAKTENDREGFCKLILGKKKTLIGATIVGDKAGEMIPLASLAIQKKLPVSSFMGMIFSYPTESEIYKFAALDLAKKGFKPWMKTLIKKLFL